MKNTRFLLLFSLLACGETQAFDCSKAFVKTDFVICSNPQILEAENELEQLYHILLSSKAEPEKEAFRQQEREWVKQYILSCGLHGSGKPPEEEIRKKQPCVQESILQRLDYFRKLVAATHQEKNPINSPPAATPVPNTIPQSVTQPNPPKPVPSPVPKPSQVPYEPNPYKRFFDGIFGAIKKSLHGSDEPNKTTN